MSRSEAERADIRLVGRRETLTTVLRSAASVAGIRLLQPGMLRAQALGRSWLGVVPGATLTVGLGVFLVGVADYAARHTIGLAEPLFWLGLLVVMGPVALALWSPVPSRTERVALVALVGVGLWMARPLYNPSGAIFYDEFSHLRTAIDVANTGRLFTSNPLQPISALYPGLEATVAMLSGLSGLSMETTGQLLIMAGRILLMLALFVLVERATGSARAAGIGALVYTCNASFLFFDAQVSYESFALPLAVSALGIIAMGIDATRHRRSLWFLAAALITATVVTHHLTSYALVVFVGIWAAIASARKAVGGAETRRDGPPILLALYGAAIAGGWLLLVAAQTVGYIVPHILGSVGQLVQLVAGGSAGRKLFVDNSGQVASVPEQAVAFAAVLFSLAGIGAGVWTLLRKRIHSSLALVLALVGLGYPATLVLRLTSAGAETASRLSEFVYVGIGSLVAVWAVAAGWQRRRTIARVLLAAATAITFVGGAVLAAPPWARLPYAYRAAADPRSVDAESIEAARWASEDLAQGQRFVADRMNRQLLGAYGGQNPTVASRAATILLSPSLDVARRAIIGLGVDYVLVDRRLSTVVPLVGDYVIGDELGGFRFTSPVPLADLTKLDRLQGASRIYDSGNIQIYDVRSIR